jgi:hypothetical protein
LNELCAVLAIGESAESHRNGIENPERRFQAMCSRCSGCSSKTVRRLDFSAERKIVDFRQN